jgi:hypothetical protein
MILLILLFVVGLSVGTREEKVIPASEVETKIRTGGPVEFDNCIIVGGLNLGKQIIKGPVHFNHTVFQDPVNFEFMTFKGYAYFRGSTFNRTSFEGSTFSLDADFNRSTFKGYADFVGSTFNRTSFEGSTFSGDASFYDSTFNRTNFRRSVFSSDAIFYDSTFNNNANFWGSKFSHFAVFANSTFNRTTFDGSVFNGDAIFYGSAFNRTSFEGSTFSLDADFHRSTFKGYADFVGSIFNRTSFEGSTFSGDAYFNRTVFNSDASFVAVQFYNDACFDDGQFKRDALFEGMTINGTLSLIRTRYDKLYVRWYNISRLAYDDAAYMTLMKNFKDLGYLEDYDSCYVKYRKEHRAQPWPGVSDLKEFIMKTIDYPLEWFYGYGKEPFNAFFISLAIVIVFAFYWWYVGLGGPKDKTKDSLKEGEVWLDDDVTDILGFSVTVFLSGTKFFIDPPVLPRIEGRSRSWIKKAFILERVLGALFSVLFFIAISGTIVRAT